MRYLLTGILLPALTWLALSGHALASSAPVCTGEHPQAAVAAMDCVGAHAQTHAAMRSMQSSADMNCCGQIQCPQGDCTATAAAAVDMPLQGAMLASQSLSAIYRFTYLAADGEVLLRPPRPL